jgi:hypothetical protein
MALHIIQFSGYLENCSALAAVNEHPQGVDYIFLDEIYMVSCNDFQMLATHAAKARNIHDDSFGSLSMVASHDRVIPLQWRGFPPNNWSLGSEKAEHSSGPSIVASVHHCCDASSKYEAASSNTS